LLIKQLEMWIPQEALFELSNLRPLKTIADLEPGDMFSRGYADLGYELFLLLPNKQAISLFSGQQITFKPDPNLFFVPTFEELLRLALDNLKSSTIQNWLKTKQVTYLSLLKLLKPVLEAGTTDTLSN
jgi:hypothetical protein